MLNLVRVWILLAVALNCAGWMLSAVKLLTPLFFTLLLLAAGLIAARWLMLLHGRVPLGTRVHSAQCRLRRRVRRLLPLAFIVLSAAALIGGLTSPANNSDALLYRTPRVIHWLGAQQWHWIHAEDHRLNIVGTGFEWLTVPLLALTRTDSWFFLINWLSYLMLPGLVFAVFRRLGVRGRVAWVWMWILPAGWCYAMQAGGVGNDSFSTIYALAMVLFALRAAETRCISELWISLLAAALVTGTKQTNTPLPALWLIAAWPCWRLFWSRPLASSTVGVAGLLASGVPMICLNILHAGTWTGWPKGGDLQPESPLWGIAGNAFVLVVQNFAPPIFPKAAEWNESMKEFLQTPLGSHFQSFERFGFVPRATSGEQAASLGLYVCALLLIAVIAAWRLRSRLTPDARFHILQMRALRLLPWALLLIFMAKIGSWSPGRYLAPYYPFLLPVFLIAPGHARLVRKRWWIIAALCVMSLTLVDLVMSRQRPLLPVNAITTLLLKEKPDSIFLHKVRDAYAFMEVPRTYLKPLIEALPADTVLVGYAVLAGTGEVQLCLPVGQRRVVRITPEDTAASMRSAGFRYVIVDHTAVKKSGRPIADWLQRHEGEVIKKIDHSVDPKLPLGSSYLVRLLPVNQDAHPQSP